MPSHRQILNSPRLILSKGAADSRQQCSAAVSSDDRRSSCTAIVMCAATCCVAIVMVATVRMAIATGSRVWQLILICTLCMSSHVALPICIVCSVVTLTCLYGIYLPLHLAPCSLVESVMSHACNFHSLHLPYMNLFSTCSQQTVLISTVPN